VILNREPVAIVNAVRLVLLAAVTFGLDLSDTQIVTAMVALEAVLTLFTRSQVTPVDEPVDDRGQSIGAIALGVFLGGLLLLLLFGAR
jgi:hypothetical protein